MRERIELPAPEQSALNELSGAIVKRYPGAHFATVRGEDPAGWYLRATVDLDDPDEVMDVVIDRLLEYQIDQQLPVYVIPLRTKERLTALLEQRQRPHIGQATSVPFSHR